MYLFKYLLVIQSEHRIILSLYCHYDSPPAVATSNFTFIQVSVNVGSAVLDSQFRVVLQLLLCFETFGRGVGGRGSFVIYDGTYMIRIYHL